MAIKTKGVNHPAIIGQDRDATVKFYTEVLGMRLVLDQPNLDEPRMTQDVDILSPRAAELVQEIREFIQAERQRQFEPLGRTWFPKKSFQKTKMPAFSARAASTYRPALTDTQSRTPATPL